MLCIWSIDGNSVAHSWNPSATNGPVAKFNKIFFFEQLSMGYIREILFSDREQSNIYIVSTKHIPSFLSVTLKL